MEQINQEKLEEFDYKIDYLKERGYYFDKLLSHDTYQDVIQAHYSTDELSKIAIRIIKASDYRIQELILQINYLQKHTQSSDFYKIREHFYDKNKKYYFIVSDAYEFTLKEFLNKNKLSCQQLYTLTHQLLEMIISLEENEIFNCDIKQSNIAFFQKNGSFILYDYNTSNYLINSDNAQKVDQNCDINTLKNNSNLNQNSSKNHLFSVGIILAEIMLGRELQQQEIIDLKQNKLKDILIDSESEYQQYVDIILNKIIRQNPQEIIDAPQLLNIIKAKFVSQYLESFSILMQSEDESSSNTICLDSFSFRKLKSCLDYEHIKLNLFEQEIKENELIEIKELLLNQNQLKTLELSAKIYIKGDQGIEKVKEMLINLAEKIIILELDFWDLDITAIGAQILGSLLKKCIYLKSLSLDFGANKFGDAGVGEIAISIRECQNLESLNLEFLACQVNGQGTLEIGKSLQSLIQLSKLSIVLSANNLTQEGSINISKYITDCQNLTNLCLDLGQNFINAKSLPSIIIPLSHLNLTKLTLTLWNNQIGEGISTIGESLKQCAQMKELELQLGANKINDNEVSIIGEQLSLLPSLMNLSLSFWSNQITNAGAKIFCGYLRKSNKLNSLIINFSRNPIDDKTIVHLFYRKKNFINVEIKIQD